MNFSTILQHFIDIAVEFFLIATLAFHHWFYINSQFAMDVVTYMLYVVDGDIYRTSIEALYRTH